MADRTQKVTADQVADLREGLLAIWLDSYGDTTLHREPHWLTAERNGIKLYTRPKRVMTRSSPIDQYKETDGLAYAFVDPTGSLVWDFDGKPNGQAMQSDFGYFAEKYFHEIEAELKAAAKPALGR